MMMMVNLSQAALSLENVKDQLNEMGKEMKVSISLMHEGVFSAMHRI
jgi:ACT domain-containing protein